MPLCVAEYHRLPSALLYGRVLIRGRDQQIDKGTPEALDIVTEIRKMPNRGHFMTFDHGWQEVAQAALDLIKRFVPANPG